MPETTPLIKAALNLRVGAGFDVYFFILISCDIIQIKTVKIFVMHLSKCQRLIKQKKVNGGIVI